MENYIRLSSLGVGSCAVISAVSNIDGIKRRLYDMGFTPGEKITCVHASPLGEPRAFLVKGAVIALRDTDAANITVYIGGERDEAIT